METADLIASRHVSVPVRRRVNPQRGAGRIAATRDTSDWSACLCRVRDTQDRAAFAELFRHFAPRVKAYLIRSGGNETQAEEATQEAMATVWHKAHLFDPGKATASTWIFTIARNKQLDAIRKQNRPEPEELPWGPESDGNPEPQVALEQEQRILRAAVDKLPEKQRALIEQAFFGDLTHNEIAEATDLPLGTIKSRIRLGLERLRHELAGQDL